MTRPFPVPKTPVLNNLNRYLNSLGNPTARFINDLREKYLSTNTNADQSYLGLGEDDFAADPFRRYQASRFDHFEGDMLKGDLRYYIEPSDNWNISSRRLRLRFERDWFKLQSLELVELGSGATITGLSLGEALADPQGLALRGGARGHLTLPS